METYYKVYTEQRLLIEYHELPPVFFRSLEYILEQFSCPFQAWAPPSRSSGLYIQVRRYMLRKTVSVPNDGLKYKHVTIYT